MLLPMMTTSDLDAFFEQGWNGHDVDRLMTFTSALFIFAGIWTIYGIRRYFEADYRRAQEETPPLANSPAAQSSATP